MFTVFLEHKLLSGIFLMLLLLSIICQIMIGVIYRNMIKETDNMSATDNKFLKQCKLKFANCYQMSGGVANIPVFVDKFLSKVSFMGISLTGFQHLAGQLMLLSIVAAGAGACREIIQGETVGKVLPYYIVSFLALYAYFSISGMVDIQGKKERLKINLVDYLENHMANKLKQSAIDWEGLTGEKVVSRREPGSLREEIGLSAVRGGERKKGQAGEQAREQAGEQAREQARDRGNRSVRENDPGERSEDRRAVFSRQEEQELEELLREFLV